MEGEALIDQGYDVVVGGEVGLWVDEADGAFFMYW